MPVVFLSIEGQPTEVPRGDIHVFSATFQSPESHWPTLTESERERASRFRLKRVQDQFVATRANLRRLLGRYLAIDPCDVPIGHADGGKPCLPPEFALEFNVSHGDGLGVFAFSRTRVGVDVERLRVVPDADGLVARFFSANDTRLFQGIAPEARPAAFFRAWTRKEAVLKAIGRGVQSLDCCDVTFLEGDEPRLLMLDGDARACERFELFAWEPADGFIAALACER